MIASSAQDGRGGEGLALQRRLRRRGWRSWAGALQHVAIAASAAFATGSFVCGCWLLLRPVT